MNVNLAEFCLVKIANQIETTKAILGPLDGVRKTDVINQMYFAHFNSLLTVMEFSTCLLGAVGDGTGTRKALMHYYDKGLKALSVAANTGDLDVVAFMDDVHKFARGHAHICGGVH